MPAVPVIDDVLAGLWAVWVLLSDMSWLVLAVALAVGVAVAIGILRQRPYPPE
jgi:hypothetical protein